MKKEDYQFYWQQPVQKKSAEKKKAPSEMKFDMPGFKKDEIRATLNGHGITITAQRKSHNIQKSKDFYSESKSSSSFSRTFILKSNFS